MIMKLSHGLTGLAAGVAGIAALSIAATAATPAPTGEPSVLVFDQPHKGGAVNISYAYLPKKGYVVIYAAGTSGKPSGEPLAHLPLEAGDHRNISVMLNTMPAPGTKLWATLYEDSDGKPGFTKGADVSLWANGKLPLENAFSIR